ncbi:restriction endonuclease subunit S [Elizabethkingia anophelis]|uniref:restriction endonuclease subunit S n=1 Tax=Elizabethkingia anophelis TaxID=1117645 RepID=UPI0024E2246E|nr:restriction endonuclease subunit S [Elizabethkingia anophelis]CAH1149995.1 hypothetical protein EAVVTKC53_03099 [Elizabethkingia anophelis]CAI9678688.1 hypothetical protein EAVVTKC53_00744 [Elizabethkingia anophelis]
MRFPSFEGEWETKKLGEIGEIVTGSTPPTNDESYYGGEHLFVSPADIQTNRYVNNSKTTLTLKGFRKGRKIKKGSSLFVCIGSTIGKVAQASEDCVTNQQINSIVSLEHNADFVFSLLEFSSKKIKLLSAEQAVPIINKTTFSNVQINIPSLSEQAKIASFLSIIDKRIQTQNKIIEQLETLIQELRNQIFKRKIRFTDTDGRDFVDWKKVKIGDILKIGNGKDYKHLQSGEIPVFGTGGFMTLVNDYLYDGETVCIGRKGTIDKPMYHEGKLWTVDTLFYTHSFQSCIPKFIFHLFQTINWLEYNEASGVPSLSKTTIEKIGLQIPSIEEQERIASFLNKIDHKIQTEKAILEQLEMKKKYLLKQMFV